MMQLIPSIQLKFWYRDGTNRPLSGGKVYFFESGTEIDAPTWQNEGGSQNQNPVILDINGEAQIWLSPDIVYDVRVEDVDGAEVFTRERVSVSGGGGSSTGDFIKKVTDISNVQSVSTSIKTTQSSSGIDNKGEVSWRDGKVINKNTITQATSSAEVNIPGSAEVNIDGPTSGGFSDKLNASVSPTQKAIVSHSDVLKSNKDGIDYTASLTEKFNPNTNDFVVYDSIHGEGDRYARLTDIPTSPIATVSDTATIDLNITSSNLTADVKDSSITTAKLADNSITSAKIVDGTIATGDIANNAITASKIANNNVDNTKLSTMATKTVKANITGATANASDVVIKGASSIASELRSTDANNALVLGTDNGLYVTPNALSSVTDTATIDLTLSSGNLSASVIDGSITSAKIADGTIVNGDIANTTITGAKLANDTITSTQIAADAVTSSELASNSVTTVKITDNNVTNAKLATMNTGTVKGNISGSTATPIDVVLKGTTSLTSNLISTDADNAVKVGTVDKGLYVKDLSYTGPSYSISRIDYFGEPVADTNEFHVETDSELVQAFATAGAKTIYCTSPITVAGATLTTVSGSAKVFGAPIIFTDVNAKLNFGIGNNAVVDFYNEIQFSGIATCSPFGVSDQSAVRLRWLRSTTNTTVTLPSVGYTYEAASVGTGSIVNGVNALWDCTLATFTPSAPILGSLQNHDLSLSNGAASLAQGLIMSRVRTPAGGSFKKMVIFASTTLGTAVQCGVYNAAGTLLASCSSGTGAGFLVGNLNATVNISAGQEIWVAMSTPFSGISGIPTITPYSGLYTGSSTLYYSNTANTTLPASVTITSNSFGANDMPWMQLLT